MTKPRLDANIIIPSSKVTGLDADKLDTLHADATNAANQHIIATNANGDATVSRLNVQHPSSTSWIELGNSYLSGYSPLINFHYGVSGGQSYNAQLKNDLNKLSVSFYNGSLGVFQNNGVLQSNQGAYLGGATFPTYPSAGMLYFHTTSGYLCYYSGANWLTVNEYSAVFIRVALSASGGFSSINLREDYRPYITKITGNSYTNAPLDASNYWTIQCNVYNQGQTVSDQVFNLYFNVANGYAAGVDKYFSSAINRLSSQNPAAATDIYLTKVGNPGTLVIAATLFYRLVIQ